MTTLFFVLTLIVGMVVGAIIVLSSFMYLLFERENEQQPMPVPPYMPPYPPMDDHAFIVNKHIDY